jgi:hypothetical protein
MGIFLVLELIAYVMKNRIAHFVVSLYVIYIYIYQGVQFFTFLHHYFHSFIVRQTNEQSNFLRWSKETHVLSNQNPYGENELQNMDPFLINTTFVKKNII